MTKLLKVLINIAKCHRLLVIIDDSNVQHLSLIDDDNLVYL